MIKLKLVRLIDQFLKRREPKNSKIFWGVAVLVNAIFDEVEIQTSQTPIQMEKKISSVLKNNAEDDNSKPKSGSFVVQTGLETVLTINPGGANSNPKSGSFWDDFPDWDERIAYQKKQAEFWKSAQKKEQRMRMINPKEKKKLFTKEELDAINYFQGTGFYQTQQDPKQRPNIFDTRYTFLRKMHNRVLRDKFLDSETLKKRRMLEDEQIETIKLGFQLQAEGKISLKEYYVCLDFSKNSLSSVSLL